MARWVAWFSGYCFGSYLVNYLLICYLCWQLGPPETEVDRRFAAGLWAFSPVTWPLSAFGALLLFGEDAITYGTEWVYALNLF